MGLVWIRKRDGAHYGKPVYEYEARDGDREFSIVWACDHGGMFGYTAYRRLPDGRSKSLKERSGITWGRTLKRCKEACEQINAATHQLQAAE
jgi:hypothetical protein